MLLTLALGMASSNFYNWFSEYSSGIEVNLPVMASGNGTFIITGRNWGGFELYGHGCGGRNSYGGETTITAYEAGDFRRVSVESSYQETSAKARKELESRIKDAATVISVSETVRSNIRKRLKRVVLSGKADSEEWFDIIVYEGGKGIKIITAKTLELALEFEQWEKTRKNYQ